MARGHGKHATVPRSSKDREKGSMASGTMATAMSDEYSGFDKAMAEIKGTLGDMKISNQIHVDGR